MAGVRVAGLIKLVAALLLLNVSLTFSNIWPTLGIGLNADLSLETAVCVLALLAARRWWNGPSAVGLRWLAGLWLVLPVPPWCAGALGFHACVLAGLALRRYLAKSQMSVHPLCRGS